MSNSVQADALPTYLKFKASPATVEVHSFLEQALLEFERKMKTSNGIPTKALAENFLQPILMLFHQWMVGAHNDILEHMHEVADYLSEGPDVDPDLAASAGDFLLELPEQLEAVKVAIVAALDQAQTTDEVVAARLALGKLTELAGNGHSIGEAIQDALVQGKDDDEDEPEDGADDESDGGGGVGDADDDLFEEDGSDVEPADADDAPSSEE